MRSSRTCADAATTAPGTVDALARLQVTTPYTLTFWWWEIALGLIVPAVVLLARPLRRSDRAVMIGPGLLVFGVIVNRWNTTLSGPVAPPDWSPGVLGSVVAVSYTPTWAEVGAPGCHPTRTRTNPDLMFMMHYNVADV